MGLYTRAKLNPRPGNDGMTARWSIHQSWWRLVDSSRTARCGTADPPQPRQSSGALTAGRYFTSPGRLYRCAGASECTRPQRWVTLTARKEEAHTGQQPGQRKRATSYDQSGRSYALHKTCAVPYHTCTCKPTAGVRFVVLEEVPVHRVVFGMGVAAHRIA